jgi:hypothetical protein
MPEEELAHEAAKTLRKKKKIKKFIRRLASSA